MIFKKFLKVQKWPIFHEMFLSDFSHRLADIGTNCMSNDSSDVLVLRGEPRFQKFSNLRILWFLFILVTGSVFAYFSAWAKPITPTNSSKYSVRDTALRATFFKLPKAAYAILSPAYAFFKFYFRAIILPINYMSNERKILLGNNYDVYKLNIYSTYAKND